MKSFPSPLGEPPFLASADPQGSAQAGSQNGVPSDTESIVPDYDNSPTFISLSDLDQSDQLTEEERKLLTIGTMFLEMEHSFTYALQRYAERHGLTVHEARALHAVHELGDAARLSAIAERIMAPLSTMTGIACRLEETGLAVRLRAPDDRRAYILRLTPEGVERASAFFTEMYVDLGTIVEMAGEEAIEAIANGFGYARNVTAQFEEYARYKARKP